MKPNVDKLRQTILQLAVEGKLVPQDPSDEPASKLLEQIEKEKQRLVKEGEIRKSKPLPPVSEDEAPFDIPASWEWVPLGELASYRKGPFGSSLTKSMFVPKSPDTVKVYEQKNAIKKDWTLGEYFIKANYFKEKMQGFVVEPGDIIVSCAGTIGELYILPKNAEVGIINQALMRVKVSTLINKSFYLHVLDLALSTNMHHAKGMAIKNIPPFAVLKSIPAPIPPLNEQKRIVAKVDELMALCDELESKSDDFLATLSKLRQTILQLAVEGKLVPQDPSDEPASKLLEQIEEEKQKLVKEGKIRKPKPLQPIEDDEKPFEAPDNWEWARLGGIALAERGTTITKSEAKEGEIPVVAGGVSFTYKHNEPNRPPNTVTVSGSGANAGFVNYWREPIFASDCSTISPYGQTASPQFLYYLLKSQESKIWELRRGAAQPHVYVRDLVKVTTCLPPLEEQKRIVAKVDELMALCDELEALLLG